MNKLLDAAAKWGSFMALFGILFLFQELAFGSIDFVMSFTIFNLIYVKDLVFAAISIALIFKFFTFYKPKRIAYRKRGALPPTSPQSL